MKINKYLIVFIAIILVFIIILFNTKNKSKTSENSLNISNNIRNDTVEQEDFIPDYDIVISLEDVYKESSEVGN